MMGIKEKPKIVIETMTILPEGQKRSNDFFGYKNHNINLAVILFINIICKIPVRNGFPVKVFVLQDRFNHSDWYTSFF
jgi:hypothetical protein